MLLYLHLLTIQLILFGILLVFFCLWYLLSKVISKLSRSHTRAWQLQFNDEIRNSGFFFLHHLPGNPCSLGEVQLTTLGCNKICFAYLVGVSGISLNRGSPYRFCLFAPSLVFVDLSTETWMYLKYIVELWRPRVQHGLPSPYWASEKDVILLLQCILQYWSLV